LRTWKSHDLIAKASEIRIPTEAGKNIVTSTKISRMGPPITNPKAA
jgi:hypothetical protein